MNNMRTHQTGVGSKNQPTTPEADEIIRLCGKKANQTTDSHRLTAAPIQSSRSYKSALSELNRVNNAVNSHMFFDRIILDNKPKEGFLKSIGSSNPMNKSELEALKSKTEEIICNTNQRAQSSDFKNPTAYSNCLRMLHEILSNLNQKTHQ